MIALGCHVFAGGFTEGVKKVMPVRAQLERHNFGRETMEQHQPDVPFVNGTLADWDTVSTKDVTLLFGNPRCTGFSSITSGYGEHIHGASAACTVDIHELCNYGVSESIPFIIWESVQQAFTGAGKPLIDHLVKDVFRPAGYRVAHILLSAASMGNAQHRRRYFFVAYKDKYIFNIEPPVLPERQVVVDDVLVPLEHITVTQAGRTSWCGPDESVRLTADETACLPIMQPGDDLNRLARERLHELEGASKKYHDAWVFRASDIPFGLHGIARLRGDEVCPTLTGNCNRLIHPRQPRGLSLREAATIMGWAHTPVGRNPFAQIAKGVCPEVGKWLAEQVVHSLNNVWDDDFESSYDHKDRVWRGQSTSAVEKVFNLTQYIPRNI